MRAKSAFTSALVAATSFSSVGGLTQGTPASSASQRQITIDPLSVRSLLLTLFSKGEKIGSATGFLVQKSGNYYLITNYHVLRGRRPDNQLPMDPQGRIPDSVGILENTKGQLGSWTRNIEPLNDAGGNSLILKHPTGSKVDVVALKLSQLQGVDLFTTDLELQHFPIRLFPTGNVSIIGFPFGHPSSGGLPIWKTGTIASDPDVDYDNSPQFLVDATARPGMSGSPVYARRANGFQDESGNYNMTVGTVDRFVGVYAGTIDGSSEVGRIWKASVIDQILNLPHK